MTTSNDPLLSVRSLFTKFVDAGRETSAVGGVSFDLRRGEFLAIVGESGSGKSVTALSILGLLPRPQGRITGGQVVFDGVDLLQMHPRQMRQIRGSRIAMIFQEPMTSLNPVLTVGDQIMEPLIQHKKLSRRTARAKAVELLNKVQIAHPERRIDEYPHQLSGGMRQRAMIAMALSCDPDILIADEPTTAVDVTIQAQILTLLKDLQREYRMAMILITHDLGIVRDCADRVLVMYDGHIVEEGNMERILATPAHPYSQMLAEVVHNLETGTPRSLHIPTRQQALLQPHRNGCVFYTRCPERIETCISNEPPRVTIAPDHVAACFNRRPVIASTLTATGKQHA